MWEDFYERYRQELLAYGTRICGSPELAEDLVQETFLKALVHTDTVEPLSPGQRRAWLYRTYKRLFLDRYRRSAMEQAYMDTLRPQADEAPGLQEVENALFLQSISPQDRAIFQLRHMEGYTAQEIASMLNIPPGTVRSRLSRCRKILKDQLQK